MTPDSTALPAAPPERFNAAAYLLACNETRGARLAYIDDRQRLSYEALADRVRRCAAGLLGLGLRREDRVLMALHDSVDFPVGFLGALYAGLVPVPVNTLLTSADYAYMLQHSGARVVLLSEPLWPALQQAIRSAADGSDREVRPVLSGSTEPLPAGTFGFDALLENPPLPQPAPTAADDFAFWLYSSGSTGRPKGTVHTHANLYWTAALYGGPVLGLKESDVCFSAAKLFFAYGLGNALTFPLAAGATTVLMAERPTPSAVFERWVEHGVSVFFGAPTGYAGMLAAPDLPRRDQVRLRLCSSAGEALPQEIGERFSEHFGCEIVDGLGSTEMLHIFLSNRPGEVRYGSTGRVVPGYRLKLLDEDGREAPQGSIGELYVAGPTSALMYWGQRDKSRATFQGEWTKTGDKYVVDAHGCYVYAGRSDDMLKVSGIYVSPFEVEATLMQHPSVLECAVIGVLDTDGLTKTKACVVRRAGRQVSDEELKAFVKERLAPYKYPRIIEFIDELPKTATGKIQRFRLREIADAASRDGAPPVASTAPSSTPAAAPPEP